MSATLAGVRAGEDLYDFHAGQGDVPPPPSSLSPASLSPASLAAPERKAPSTSRSWRAFFAALASVALLAVAAPRVARAINSTSAARIEPAAPATPAIAPAPPTRANVEPRADRALNRRDRGWVQGGVLIVPPYFSSSDGAFDVVVHFHGATTLVEQSFEAVKLDAVVVVFNLGVSSMAYGSRFTAPSALASVLDEVRRAMTKRGLEHARIRRVALSGFSAGYAAVERALEEPGALETVDSVLLLDGLHTSYDYKHQLDMERLAGVTSFAKAAVRGEKLLYLTHSSIPTYGYASTTVSSDALLAELGLSRSAGGDKPPMPDVAAIATAVAKKDLKPLDPVSHAEKGSFFLRGYSGETKPDHLAHLIQMASTALPSLAARWSHVP